MSDLQLLKFVPFRLNRLAAEVSNKLAEVYSDRFGIDIVEWRILITLAAHESCSAQFIVNCTRTHKSRISRGVSRMLELKLVARTESKGDRRQTLLRLTAKGKALHQQLVPVVLAQERKIMECLDEAEFSAFTQAMDKLERSLDLVHHLDDEYE
jgi:DNA-binding MarR family transcriptional regulator